MEFCSLQRWQSHLLMGSQALGGCRGRFLQAVGAWGEASSGGCGAALPPQDAVSGQSTGCPGQAAVLGYKGTAGLVGEQAGQRKCPLGSSSMEILTYLCQGYGMHDFKKNILVAVNCSLIS